MALSSSALEVMGHNKQRLKILERLKMKPSSLISMIVITLIKDRKNNEKIYLLHVRKACKYVIYEIMLSLLYGDSTETLRYML